MAHDGRFDVKTIATLLTIDPRRVQQLVNEGWIPRGDRGRYKLVESVQGYIKYLREHQREANRGSQHSRLASAQATKVEIENFRRMGELIVKAQSDETMMNLIVMMRSSHEGLPGRLANELAGLEPPLIYQRLQTELRKVLDQCADFLEKRADALEAMPEPSEATAPTAAGDAGGVGETQEEDAAGQSGEG